MGLIITGATRVNNLHGATAPRQLSMANDRHIAPFAAMVDRIHAHGAKVFCQLHHPGRQGLSLMGSMAPQIELMGRLWPGMYKHLPKLFTLDRKGSSCHYRLDGQEHPLARGGRTLQGAQPTLQPEDARLDEMGDQEPGA